MSDFLGQQTGPPPSGPFGPDQVEEPAERPLPLLLILLALVVVVGGVGLAIVWQMRGESIDHPDEWDKLVAPYATVVAAKRKLSFEHPIYVDFLEPEEFEEQVTADEEELTAEDRKEIEQYTGQLRALGLVDGELDLLESMNELQGAGVIGYYSYADKRIRIKGTELTPAVQSTLVHELTHALQDQHFNLEDRFEEYDEDPTRESTFRALVEGDAKRIEAAWREDLSKQEQKALAKEQARESGKAIEDIADVPKVLATLMAAPYAFGEAMLKVALEHGGTRAVDDLFVTPPTTEEQTYDPWTMVVDHQGELTVEEPELEDGEDEFDDGHFGSIGWLVVLSERLPVDQALTATDGWGGDSYVAFERDGKACVRIRYAGDTPKDLTQMRTALGSWVARSPAKGTSRVRREGSRLLFESCDPGRAATGGSGGSQDAVSLAVSRSYLALGLVNGGVDVAFARCGSDRMVRAFTVKELNDPAIDQQRVAAVVAPCFP